ncbi:hypothetical protein Nmel_013501 [Mimus melanotis]
MGQTPAASGRAKPCRAPVLWHSCTGAVRWCREGSPGSAVTTALYGHATRGDRAGTASALTHRCWLRAGQGCPPLPRIPAAGRAPLRSGRAPPRERQFPSAVTAGARPELRPPALAAPARSGWDGWDGMGAAGSGAAAAGRAAGAGAVARTPSPWERAAALGGGALRIAPSSSDSTAVPDPGEAGSDGTAPQTAALPAARGPSGGDGAGAVPVPPAPANAGLRTESSVLTNSGDSEFLVVQRSREHD